MKRMKGIVYGGLLSVVFVLSGCSGSQKEGRDSKEIPVEIVKVAKTVPADTRNYVGTVEEVVSSSISFQVMGNVERVLVGEGQKVREGQLLAVLDKATLENAYNASAASLRQAEDAYARMRTLHENKSLPDMKWVEVESKLEQARSMERISRKNLEDRNLYAPFGGVIGKRMVEAGENVQPGQPVFSLLRIETVNVKIAVPENEVATLGDQAAMIKVAALGGQRYRGQPHLPHVRGEDPAGEPVRRSIARHGLRCTPVGRGIRAGYRLAEQRRADSERRGAFRLEDRRRRGESYARTDGRLDGARLVYSGRVERGGYRRDRRLPENQ